MSKINFRIGLSGTYWDKKPQYSVIFNGKSMAQGSVSNEPNVTEYITFSQELEDESTGLLEIRLENKEDSDVVQNNSQTEIVKDMLLNIDSIEIDDVDLGMLKWTASEFIPDDSTKPNLKNCVNLGWNGSYTIKFTDPFYLWFLENS